MTARYALVFWFGLSVSASGADSEQALGFRKELDRVLPAARRFSPWCSTATSTPRPATGIPTCESWTTECATVPYLLEPVVKHRTIQVRQPCAAKVVSLHVDEGRGLEIVIELDEKAPAATGATIRTPLADYERRVRVYGSRSGTDWSSLVTDGTIFDYSRFMDIRNRDVVIPANDYRRFKLTVERELDDRESPLRELIRRQSDGKKDEQVEITQSLRAPSESTGSIYGEPSSRRAIARPSPSCTPPRAFESRLTPKRR